MKLKLIALLLSAAALLPMATACTQEPADTTAATTTTAPVQNEEPEERTSEFAEPARELIHQIIDDYWNRRNNTLKTDLGNNGAAVVWGYVSFVEAMAEAYRLFPDDSKIATNYKGALEGLDAYAVTENINTPTGRYNVTYFNAGRGGRGDYYYDDDAWICIQYLNAYELLQDKAYLQKAEETLEFLWTGWDEQLGGGIYWDKTYGGKNTCANGPVAISFLWAYQLTENADYLSKGKAVYDWTREALLDGSLYADSINLKGEKNNWKAAYNQGVMVYAGAQLYEITGDETYLKQARTTNTATLNLMFKGAGSATKMNGNPIYKSWCIGWLTRGYLKFYSVDPKKNTLPMKRLEACLSNNLETKNARGYYDPYFQSGDWGNESTTDVLQPCGISTVLSLAAYYDLVLKESK